MDPITILSAFLPVAMPTDGKQYSWDEATTSWVEVTAK